MKTIKIEFQGFPAVPEPHLFVENIQNLFTGSCVIANSCSFGSGKKYEDSESHTISLHVYDSIEAHHFAESLAYYYNFEQAGKNGEKAGKKFIETLSNTLGVLNKGDEQIQKPQLGIMPEKLWKEKRLKEIKEVIARYISAKQFIPHVWISEHDKLCLELLNGE